MEFTHIDTDGSVKMVDVGDKPVTEREAVAEGFISLLPQTLARIYEGNMPKGNVIETARLAGIMAAKRTADLIPLCHTLLLSAVDIGLQRQEDGIRIRASVRLSGQTGAEMEALTAVSVTALTIYDMCKAVDKEMVITGTRLIAKRGGRSGVMQKGDFLWEK